jgi:hypothetical protein
MVLEFLVRSIQMPDFPGVFLSVYETAFHGDGDGVVAIVRLRFLPECFPYTP